MLPNHHPPLLTPLHSPCSTAPLPDLSFVAPCFLRITITLVPSLFVSSSSLHHACSCSLIHLRRAPTIVPLLAPPCFVLLLLRSMLLITHHSARSKKCSECSNNCSQLCNHCFIILFPPPSSPWLPLPISVPPMLPSTAPAPLRFVPTRMSMTIEIIPPLCSRDPFDLKNRGIRII